jgi:hypothetical protein
MWVRTLLRLLMVGCDKSYCQRHEARERGAEALRRALKRRLRRDPAWSGGARGSKPPTCSGAPPSFIDQTETAGASAPAAAR